jgi:hypothetical protein
VKISAKSENNRSQTMAKRISLGNNKANNEKHEKRMAPIISMKI